MFSRPCQHSGENKLDVEKANPRREQNSSSQKHTHTHSRTHNSFFPTARKTASATGTRHGPLIEEVKKEKERMYVDWAILERRELIFDISIIRSDDHNKVKLLISTVISVREESSLGTTKKSVWIFR